MEFLLPQVFNQINWKTTEMQGSGLPRRVENAR